MAKNAKSNKNPSTSNDNNANNAILMKMIESGCMK